MKKFIFNLTHWNFNWDDYQREYEALKRGYPEKEELLLKLYNKIEKYYPEIFDRGYTDKDFLRKLIKVDGKEKGAIVLATGGTSFGVPFKFKASRKSLACRIAAWKLRWEQCGYKEGDRVLKIWYPSRAINEGIVIRLKEKLRRIVENEFFLSYFGIYNRDLKKDIEYIWKIQPDGIDGYGYAIFLIADFALKNRIKLPSPTWIITSGGRTTKEERKTIEEAFEAPVFDRYGCSEFGEVASQLPGTNETYAINVSLKVDFVRDKSDGLYWIEITDPRNLETPFYRYRLEDKAKLNKNGEIVEIYAKKGLEGRVVTYPLQKVLRVKFL
jgi:phenylacetate-CoA ligase